MSSQQPFRGGRGGNVRGHYRGRGRRVDGPPRNNFNRDDRSDRPVSPDRRSMHSEEQFPARFNNYRQPPRHNSRSLSPPNRQQQNRNNSFEGRGGGRQMNDNRRRSPDNRPHRNEDRRFEGNSSRNAADDTIDVRAVIEDRHPTYRLTGKEKAREWKLRFADAEEAVRCAEYALRRAKMDLEAINEAYEEYTRTTIPQELVMPPRPAW